jgi:hypothetical protein
MFKRIVIHLEKPICDCKKEDLSWFINPAITSMLTLRVFCNHCRRSAEIFLDKLPADIILDKPYPESEESKLLVGSEQRSSFIPHSKEFNDSDKNFLEELGIGTD